MKKLSRIILLILVSSVVFGCTPGGTTSLSKKDLSKVVLQQSDVPAAFSNLRVFGDQDAEMFFPHEDAGTIESYYGVSYLYPKDGMNLIYSVIVVYDYSLRFPTYVAILIAQAAISNADGVYIDKFMDGNNRQG